VDGKTVLVVSESGRRVSDSDTHRFRNVFPETAHLVESFLFKDDMRRMGVTASETTSDNL
jgi:hypothetical protein